MALELVAGRLVAKGLGFSLYTWTAVIGVILAGITAGYYIGGRIADKFDAKKALAALFTLASASCVLTIILNNTVGKWLWIWYLDWPIHVFAHVTLVFLLPSSLLWKSSTPLSWKSPSPVPRERPRVESLIGARQSVKNASGPSTRNLAG